MMQVEGLFIYPIKSCRGIALAQAELTPTGLQHDRRWMVVAADSGQAITQREVPALATVTVALNGAGLTVSTAALGQLTITPPPESAGLPVVLFGKTTFADAGLFAADDYFSQLAQQPCRLVHQGRHRRPVSETWAAEASTSLSDGFPVLVVNKASLEDLNSRLEAPLPMDRFRPNIVIGGASAWDEDGWHRLTLGDVTLDCVKPCTRCVITTLDQRTGIANGNQPLQALTRFRMIDDRGLKGTIFGQNAVPVELGSIVCKTQVTVTCRSPVPNFRAPPARRI